MNKLILILTLLSFNVFAENPPPAGAFRATLYGYEVALYVNEIFGSQYGVRAIYKSGDEWLYLDEPGFYESEIDTKEKADAKFRLLIDSINSEAYIKLNPISLEPEGGIDRIQWLLENNLSVIDNEIIVK